MLRPILKLRRTDVFNRRPSPNILAEGEIAINYHSNSPGLFFKDTEEKLVKVGVAQVGSEAPIPSDNIDISIGELWYDLSTEMLKIWRGTEWKSVVPPAIVDPQPRVQTIIFQNTDGSSTQFIG